jgi:predicted transcriptional regulator
MSCACSAKPLTEEQKQILETMDKCQEPCGSKDIAAATGLEAKAISSRITAMKKKGLVESPVRCKYSITEDGRSALKSC